MAMSVVSLRMSVLIVESDPQTLEALSVYFRIHGCTTSAAANAAEALAAMGSRRFDLVIADYRLPDGDGASLLQTSVARRGGAVRFLTTAYPCDACPIREDLTGIDEVVRKPFTGDELRERIECQTHRITARIAELA